MGAAGLTVVMWASAFVVIRGVGPEVSPGPLALARLGMAALVLTPFALTGSRPLLPRGATLTRVLAYGVLWFAGYNLALNTAEQYISAGTAALLVNLAPLLIAVGAGIFLGEGFPRPLLIGSVVALVGVATMTLWSPDGSGRPMNLLGALLGLAAAVLYAASVLLQKPTLHVVSPLRSVWMGCVIGSLVLLPFVPDMVRDLAGASPSAVLGVIYLALFPTAMAFTTWAYALNRLPAGRLGALVGYLVTLVALIMSWRFLNEAPNAPMLTGGAICLAGVTISQWRPRR
jgi:drug/metabolite transporter (DMT)-like permease